jgi:hypothetical protein
MAEIGQPRPPSSRADDGGVRVVPGGRAARWSGLGYLLAAMLIVGSGIAYLLSTAAPSPAPPAAPAERADARVAPALPDASRATTAARVDSARLRRVMPVADAPEEPHDLPSLDPDDLAAHFAPGDAEPTGAELIEALHHAGVRTGIGAFNPPGTSPPLHGLRVPDDFELPEGYVRHHQVTDAGEPIEPILLFSPDFAFHDEHGEPIAIPEDRVVPPELAPPGMPIEPVEIPPTP